MFELTVEDWGITVVGAVAIGALTVFAVWELAPPLKASTTHVAATTKAKPFSTIVEFASPCPPLRATIFNNDFLWTCPNGTSYVTKIQDK